MRAVATIGHCDAKGALAPVVPLLSADVQHEDELTRRTAISALHAVGRDYPEAAVPALVRACDDERLLDAALLALVEIGKSAQAAATCFRRFAKHRDGKIRRLAMCGLGAIGADDVLDGDSRTPLIHATLAGNMELLMWLLSIAGWQVCRRGRGSPHAIFTTRVPRPRASKRVQANREIR